MESKLFAPRSTSSSEEEGDQREEEVHEQNWAFFPFSPTSFPSITSARPPVRVQPKPRTRRGPASERTTCLRRYLAGWMEMGLGWDGAADPPLLSRGRGEWEWERERGSIALALSLALQTWHLGSRICRSRLCGRRWAAGFGVTAAWNACMWKCGSVDVWIVLLRLGGRVRWPHAYAWGGVTHLVRIPVTLAHGLEHATCNMGSSCAVFEAATRDGARRARRARGPGPVSLCVPVCV